MSACDPGAVHGSVVGEFDAFDAAMAALRQLGADQFDPVHLHYLDVLARRGKAQSGRVKSLLDVKLAKALAAFKARFEQAQTAAKEAVDRTRPTHPQAGENLQRLLQAGDFSGLTQFIAELEKTARRTPLRELARDLAPRAPEHGQLEPGFDEYLAARPELKTSSVFRNTWSKLSVARQVTRALEQAPSNAGPINSHMLVLRSLALMRGISPDYLNRFTSYAETLLCLDQAAPDKSAKTKPRRAKPR